ncbi:MAG: metal ABC transporter substrate-binding protein [Anaerolineales bacterium]
MVFQRKVHISVYWLLLFTGFFVFSVIGCAPRTGAVQKDVEDKEGGRLRVVATTNIVGDVVGEVGGAWIDLTVLLPPGSNPHAYQPAPRDMSAVSEADVIFANGLKLETFLEDILASAGGEAKVVIVSEGVEVRVFNEKHEEGEGTADHDLKNPDPHVWFDPRNVIIWTENIESALAALDPAHSGTYRRRSDAYREQLRELDEWIADQVAKIPEENRELVTDHTAFGYFANRYGFEQVGAVVPAPTTEAQPSGKQLAQLEEKIQAYDVQAIFVGRDFDPALSARVAEDTGVQLVPLHFGSLTPPDGEAPTYLTYMRENVRAIVKALR